MEIVELTKASEIVSRALVSNILESAIDLARHNELLTFVDSFGANYSLEESCITICWDNQIWDKNKDDYPFAEDSVEPVSIFLFFISLDPRSYRLSF